MVDKPGILGHYRHQVDKTVKHNQRVLWENMHFIAK